MHKHSVSANPRRYKYLNTARRRATHANNANNSHSYELFLFRVLLLRPQCCCSAGRPV